MGIAHLAFSQTADFKVQHIQDEVGNTGGTNTSFTTLGSLNSVVELANNNRKTHGGPNTHSGNKEGDDMSGARQLTGVNTLTYYRASGSDSRDARFNSSLWEYIGAANGNNEFIVRGRYAIALNGTTNSTTQAISGVVNANKCIPFITGIINNATGNDADSGTAVAYLENATTLRVQKGSNGNNVTIYITVVEFTGANWTVLHGDSGAVNADTGTITLRDGSAGTGSATNVSSWSDAVIFGHFRADTGASGANDNISDLWPVLEPGSNNQSVDWVFHSNHDSAGTNRHFVHVLTNSGLNVTRFQNTTNSAGQTTIDITAAGLTDVNQAFIVGSTTSSGNGTAYGRGWRNYYLNSTTEAAHWVHRSGNTVSHEIQIVDLSALQTTYPGPEMNVLGNGISILDGNTAISLSDHTDFGEVEASGVTSVTRTYTIQNLGSTDLTLDNPSPYIVIIGSTADFTLVANPSTPIAAAGSTTFSITYDPTTSGTHLAMVSIANNDSDENPYTFLIQGKGEYCSSNGSTDYNTSVTFVSFNTISNADNEIPKDNAYEDFTNLSTNVYKNSTHDLTVRVNTDGNFQVFTIAWIDWNNDGDYDDAGEAYDLGSATNVVDGLTSNSPLSITVPANAEIGLTEMRVATKWQSYPSSCDSGFDGEVEDYSINVIDYLVDFDGVDEYIDFGDNHDLTSSFSLESWVLQEATVAKGTIISKGNTDLTLKTGYHLTIDNGYPNLTWYDNANSEVLNVTSPYAIPNNEWHHIAATYDGTTARLYLDGIEVISGAPSAAPLDVPQHFKIGAETANYATTPINVNFFNGAIQEARVWDVALTATQIREMMNQHIEENTTNVKGMTLPVNISGGLLWTNLRGYYPLDSNTAFDSSGYGIDGTPHEIKSSQIVSAPLPYETDGDSSWDTNTTWLNYDNLYIPNTTGLDGTTSIDWNIVDLTNDVSSGDRNISLLGLISTTGTLTVSDPGEDQDETNSGRALTISGYLELDGVIDLVGESQLIQTDGSIIDADSGGYIERDQQGTANGFNYNYWSSSVGPRSGNTATRGTGVSSTNANHTISGVLHDGTISGLYQDLTFDASPNASDGTPPPPGFARTVSSYWMYKFYGDDDDYNAWEKIDETSSLLPGEGFTMKGTSGSVSIVNQQNYVFEGLPNNGDIILELDKTSGDVDRLIGNPYPSAIDATAFILDNMSTADGGNNATGTIFNGALYFWDHFGEENSHNLKDYVGGYATRNLTGGAAAISNDARINNTSNGGSAATGTKVPGQYIPVNQGFFVSTALDGFDDNNGTPIDVVDGGDIMFKNSQRVFATENGSTSLFLKPAKRKGVTNKEIENTKDDTPIIRLIYHSPSGYHRQLVLGAHMKASLDFDLGYDAFMVDVSEEDMYWNINGDKFVIQGVDEFNESQEFLLGLIVKSSGIARIRVDALENIEPNPSLYIKDNVTGETFQINEEPFEIYLEEGVYNDRFKLVFQASGQSLGSDEINTLSNDFITYYDTETSEIRVINKVNTFVSYVKIYNMLGQEVKHEMYRTRKNIFIPVSVSNGVYLLEIKTENGIFKKKIILK
ncbi:LamG-like jellyroll fold domain-containing protein [Seonamhaeicola sp.]|uniref:LamG-like jellyroll fold domain-containing protein n=1 Tax=Seonamhaeicola sp. TaxID=1912245 RepID=UPI0026330EB6|nr:LamG-like jellyroll fold domain-containing protein [Seonamhaeicola sp.]